MIFWRTDAGMTSPSIMFTSLLYKTNRLHVVVGLYTNKSQMSRRGQNISYIPDYASCATLFVFTTFWRHLWSITVQTHGNMESIYETVIRFLILLDLSSFVVEHWKARSERLEGKSSWRTHDFLSTTLMKTWVTTSFFWNKFHCTVQLLPAIQVDSSWLTWC